MPDGSSKVLLSEVEGSSGQQSFQQQAAASDSTASAAAASAAVQESPQQTAAGGSATLLTAVGPRGAWMGQTLPQGIVSGQGPFDAAVMQAAIMQIGHAAQSHAVEAARLQVMAASLQDGSRMPAAAQFFMPGGALAFGPAVQGASVTSAAPGVVAYSAPPGQALPGAAVRGACASATSAVNQRNLVSCSSGGTGDAGYGRQPSGGTGSSTAAGSDHGTAAAEEFSADGTAETAAINQAPPRGFVGDLDSSGITVKNTFVDFPSVPSSGALRTVQTASGRLDLMADQECT